MNLFYKISIDHVNANYLSGWCFNRFKASRIVELQCFSGNALLATVRADRFREDLKSLGIHPSGRCGFEMVIEAPPVGTHTAYSIREKRSGRELAVIPMDENRVTYMHPFSRVNVRKISGFGKRRRDDKLIVFMHIPKTAGTSFNTFAQQMYGSTSARIHIELQDRETYPEMASSHSYISGHLRFCELAHYFAPDLSDYYTVLREPYAQLHSHLKWLIQTASDSRDTFFKHNNPVIYRLGEELAGIDTFSPRKLIELVERMNGVEAAFFENMQTRYFLKERPDRVTANDFQEALINKGKFKLIGTTEAYDLFVYNFARINAITNPEKRNRMNISKSDDLYDLRDPHIREILKPLVYFDLKLYDSVSS